jgi:uncharacterized protein YegP (UPF0339 family)
MNGFIYKADDGFRWRLKARNGRLMAESGEAYASKGNAERGILRLLELLGAKWIPIWYMKRGKWVQLGQ